MKYAGSSLTSQLTHNGYKYYWRPSRPHSVMATQFPMARWHAPRDHKIAIRGVIIQDWLQEHDKEPVFDPVSKLHHRPTELSIYWVQWKHEQERTPTFHQWRTQDFWGAGAKVIKRAPAAGRTWSCFGHWRNTTRSLFIMFCLPYGHPTGHCYRSFTHLNSQVLT